MSLQAYRGAGGISARTADGQRALLTAGNPDGTCNTQSVVNGDTCESLASKCGINQADLEKVNTKMNLCYTLLAGELVCCSTGTLPATNGSEYNNATEEDYAEGVYLDLNYWSDCTENFTSLQQLEDKKDSIPDHCMEQYILDVQVAVFEAALLKYKDLIDHHYDEKFKIYEKFAKAQVPGQLNNFVASDKVDKYFKCHETKDVKCCKDCYKGACHGPCEAGSSCQPGLRQVDMDKCPKYEFEARPLSGSDIPNATFTFTDSKGFYADLSATWGIDESWITLGKRRVKIGNGCQYAPDVKECEDKQNSYFYDYPLATNITIDNPKNVLENAYPTASDLLRRFKIIAALAEWDETLPIVDSVDATSIPAFTLDQAVESMQNITEKADDIAKQEREQLILDFLSALLFFIPIAGEAAGAASLTTVGNLLRLIGVTGEAGMLVHDIVADPQNAFISIFIYLAGAGVGKKGFRDAAESRRDLPAAEKDRLGGIKLRLDRVESLRGKTC